MGRQLEMSVLHFNLAGLARTFGMIDYRQPLEEAGLPIAITSVAASTTSVPRWRAAADRTTGGFPISCTLMGFPIVRRDLADQLRASCRLLRYQERNLLLPHCALSS